MTTDDLAGALRRNRRRVFAVASVVLVAWILWLVRDALTAFLIGALLALLLDPAVTALHRRGLPRWAGVLLLYVVLIAAVSGLVIVGVPPVVAQVRDLVDRLPAIADALSGFAAEVQAWYGSLALPPPLRSAIDQSVGDGGAFVTSIVRAVLEPTASTVLRATGFLFGLAVVPVWLFYVLKDRDAIGAWLLTALPVAWRPDAANAVALGRRVGGRWLRGQLLLGAAVFVATAIGLTVLALAGIAELGRVALVLALVAGLLELVPFIGPIIAAVPAVLVALSVSPGAALAVLVLYLAIQQLENHVLVPNVMGDAVDLHPAIVIVALVSGAYLFGLVGAILAAPVVAVARDLYRYTDRRLGGASPAEARAAVVPPTVPPPEPALEREVEDGTDAAR